MIFRRIIYNAVLVGLLAGLLFSVVQVFSVNPIIFAAEAYEVAREAQDDGQRTMFTFFSNMLAGIGFAAVILALMSQIQLSLSISTNWIKGVLWGLAGFLTVFVAPGIGLPPEIPGIQAAAVEHRQIWWALTVCSAAAGLGVIAFAPLKLKLVGFIFLVIPYLFGAPHIDGPQFLNPDPLAVEALQQLHQQFIIASGFANLIFWLALGVACSVVLNRWIIQRVSDNVIANA